MDNYFWSNITHVLRNKTSFYLNKRPIKKVCLDTSTGSEYNLPNAHDRQPVSSISRGDLGCPLGVQRISQFYHSVVWHVMPCYIAVCYNDTRSIPNKFMLIHLPPFSAAYLRRWTGSASVQMIASRLFGAKPLTEPILSYRHWNLETNFSEIIIEIQFFFHSWQFIWKCHLQKGKMS